MPRAVLVQPSIHDFYATPHRFTGLGMASVQRVLDLNGWDTTILVLPLIGRPRSLSLPAALSHLQPHLIQGEAGPVRYFSSWRRFGPSPEEAAEMIFQEHPDLILIETFAWAYAEDTIELARALRRLQETREQTGSLFPSVPPCPIITGGAGVTVLPAYFEESALFDAVLPGEAESSLPIYLETLQKNAHRRVDGMPAGTYRPDSTKHCGREGTSSSGTGQTAHAGVAPDPFGPGATTPVGAGPGSSRPNPAAHTGDSPPPIWTARRLSSGCVRVTTVLSRGCPKRCRFCSQHLTQGRTLRTAPLQLVDRMIASWPEGTTEVNIEDDNLLLDRNYFFTVLGMIHNRFPGVQMFAENGIDYTLINGETLDRLWNTGFRSFNLSLASIHPDTLRSQSRPANIRRWEHLVQEIDARGGSSTTYFICGLDDDTPEKAAATLIYLSRFPTQPGISLFYPVPGLPGFTDPARFRRSVPFLALGSAAWPWTGSLTTTQMVTAFRLTRFIAHLHRVGSDDLIQRTLKTSLLWTQVRDHGNLVLRRVPVQDEAMSRSVLAAIASERSTQEAKNRF